MARLSTMSVSVLVNGLPAEAVPADDRGLAYGDGVFETLYVEQGHIHWLDRHLQRLVHGCERLRIDGDGLADRLLDDIAALLAQTAPPDPAVLKLMVTRGSSERGYAIEPGAAVRRIVKLTGAPRYPEGYYSHGVKVRLCQTRLAQQPLLAGIKHLNRLEQVLARMELSAGEQEGLLCDSAGHVIEGTCSNLFARYGEQLVTPSLDDAGVAGIARELVLEHAAAAGVAVVVEPLTPSRLLRADALVVTNSIIGAWPVADFDGQRFQSVELAAILRNWIRNEKGIE